MSQKIRTSVEIDGSLNISQIANSTFDTDKFLVAEEGTVKYRTGAELLSDLGIVTGTANHVQHQVKAGVAINKGQAVYVTGADGTNMIVGLASNASEATSSKTMGLLNATVAANGFADVITEGLLAGLNTIGANAGDPVWLGTGGNLIYGLTNKPSAPNHLVFIGIVTRVNANNGEIFVKVQNGFELNEIHDVDLKTTLPSGNDILAFEGAPVNLWKNKTIPAVLGYTPYNASNPAGYTTNTGTVTSVSGTGGYGGLTLSGSVTTSGSLTLGGTPTGTWPIGISGNAATATNADYANSAGYAGNAGTLDGIDSSLFIYGDNSTGTASISDATLNGALKSGFYTVGTGGIPNATSVNFVLHTAYNGVGNLAGFDLACNDSTTSSFYLRPATGGGKGSWQTIVTSANVGSYAVPLSRTITINGTSYDLSANRSWTVTGTETDTLATVTARGNTTSTGVGFNNYVDILNQNSVYWYNSGNTIAARTYFDGGTFNLDKSLWVTANIYGDVFYDRNNSAYYGDFASTSRINTINIDTLRGPQGDWLLGYQSTLTYSLGSTAVVDTLNIDFSTVKFSPGSGNLGNNYFWLNKGGSNDGGLLWSRDNALDWQMINATGSGDLTFYAYGSGTNVLTLGRSGGAVTATGSMRAPIFYDSNDTGYYLDPASTSKISKLYIRNGGAAGVGWSSGLVMGDDSNYWNMIQDAGVARQRNYGVGGYDWFSSGGSQLMVLSNSGNLTVTNELTVGTGGSSTINMYDSDEGTRLIHCNSNRIGFLNQSASWGSYCTDNGDWVTDTVSYAGASSRAPIFYDTNDTSYYLDPTDGSFSSVLSGTIRLQSGAYGTNSRSSSSQGPISRTFAPQGAANSFQGGNVTGAIKIRLPFRANDCMWSMKVRIYEYTNDATSEYTIGNYSYSAGAYHRGAYYIGGIGSSPQTVRFGNDGSYDCVWIGETSKVWSHPVVGVVDFMGGYVRSDVQTTANNWDVTFVSTFGNIGDSVTPSVRFSTINATSLSVDSAIYSPIYYDANNTGYYVDASSTSYLNVIQAANRIFAGWDSGQSGSISCSNWFRTNGSTGWYNESYAGGWYMVDSSWVRSYNDKGVYTGGVMQSGSSHRAPIFYDTDNTGYYLDPSGTSYINSLQTPLFISAGTYVDCTNISGGAFRIYNGSTLRGGLGTDSWANGGGSLSSDINLYSSGNTYFNTNGVRNGKLDTSGNFIVSGDVTAYGSPSDIRLKTIKEKIPNALDSILKLNGYRFDWKNPDEILNIKEDIGVIAQEVEAVFPELARTNENGLMSVRHQGLTAVLIEAIKEQQTQIEELKELVNKLIKK